MAKIELKNVSIKYVTGDIKSIGLKEYFTKKATGDYQVKNFWAIDGVNFTVTDGDFLGIIGGNGAGKSTLLKSISGIMRPSSGTVKVEGKIAALLELGAGFDGDLTVKENIFLRGAMLGYTKEFMLATYDDIIEFSELREFQHRPFKQLSSGMKSRIAFSIGCLVNPDILILDEVLSVGDGIFASKSEAKMNEVIANGSITILVSHSIGQIRSMCNKVLWLHKGKQMAFGDADEICDQYEAFVKMQKAQTARVKYDYLVVGAGLFGAVFANEMFKKGKRCLVIDKRSTIAGNVYTSNEEGIDVHKYGAHIFHTNSDRAWKYVNNFATFNNYINSPIANYKGEIYNLPFNMNTFAQILGTTTPKLAREKIAAQVEQANITTPTNLEEKAISLVGTDIYEKLIKGYTQKNWGKPCNQLPASIIERLPLRFNYDNNYFNAKYQGIPVGGYTEMVEKMLANTDVILDTDYKDFIKQNPDIADKTLYTGGVDELLDYELGELEYRSLRFEQKMLSQQNFQGVAVMNFTDIETPYTRVIEHKFFNPNKQKSTIVSYEYPAEWKRGLEAYYPINDEINNNKYNEYKKLLKKRHPDIILGGRLGLYRYIDMDQTILKALDLANKEG